MTVALPWTTRHTCLWVEEDIPTQGGMYGWDHSIHTRQPIPWARRLEWTRRRHIYEEQAAAHPTLFDTITN